MMMDWVVLSDGVADELIVSATWIGSCFCFWLRVARQGLMELGSENYGLPVF